MSPASVSRLSWWCETCQAGVHPEAVTYDETHDLRAGGCGQHVLPEKPVARSSKEQLSAALDAWEQLSPTRWKETGLQFDRVLSRRAEVITDIIKAAQKLVEQPDETPARCQCGGDTCGECRVHNDAARFRYLLDQRDVMLNVAFFGNGERQRTPFELRKAIDAARRGAEKAVETTDSRTMPRLREILDWIAGMTNDTAIKNMALAGVKVIDQGPWPPLKTSSPNSPRDRQSPLGSIHDPALTAPAALGDGNCEHGIPHRFCTALHDDVKACPHPIDETRYGPSGYFCGKCGASTSSTRNEQ